MRLYESLVIEQSDHRIMRYFNIENRKFTNECNKNVCTASGYVIGLHDDGTLYSSFIEQDCNWSSSFFDLVCENIIKEFAAKLNTKQIFCRHYFKVNKLERYHAHPQY